MQEATLVMGGEEAHSKVQQRGSVAENVYLLGVGVLASLTAMALIGGYVKLLAGVGDPEPFPIPASYCR